MDLSKSNLDYFRHWLATMAYTSVWLKNIDANSPANADSPWCTHQAVSTFSASQNQSRIGHVIAQVDVRSSTEDAPSFLQRDIGFNRNSVGPNHRPVGASLALDLTTLGIPARSKQIKGHVWTQKRSVETMLQHKGLSVRGNKKERQGAMNDGRGEPRRFSPPVIKAITSINKKLDYRIHPKGNAFRTISQQE